jgi:anti-sigma regulatory factor (Ser/Thr protein kinase)
VAVDNQDIVVARREHVVQFYEHDAELLGAVVPYLAAGVAAGEVAIVIATKAHRRALEVELGACGIDLARAGADGRLVSLDAAATMASFMAGGQIDRDAFHELVGGLMREARKVGRPVRAYGEMVALLWEAGDVLAAIELETLWNDLAREHPFSLFCSYPAASVSGSECADALHAVCRLHSSVFHPASDGLQTDGHADGRILAAAEYPAEPESPGRARRLAVRALRGAGHDDALVYGAAIVLSELANNAVLHAGSAFSIAVRIQDSTLHIAVRDASPLDAAAVGQGLIVRLGHGLGLIEALATCWGIESAPAGKVVWAELSIDRRDRAVRSCAL